MTQDETRPEDPQFPRPRMNLGAESLRVISLRLHTREDRETRTVHSIGHPVGQHDLGHLKSQQGTCEESR